jgi:hypothetical protein
MTAHKYLRTYRFIDKDPVCDELRTLVQDEGLYTRLKILAELTNLAHSTLHNLFHGGTRRPQNATAMAIGTALGYKREWVKERKLDVEKELEFARAWNIKERKRLEAAREKDKPTRKRRA